MEVELGRLGATLCTLRREQEHIKKMIRSLSSKLDNITGSSANNHHNHQRSTTRQARNQERTNAEAGGSAANNETEEGKDSSIRLRFLSKMKPLVYHDKEIKPIRIGIYDGDTMIKSGPFSELKIELVALEGSFPHDARGRWTPEEFHEHRAYGRDGQGNVLAGKGTKAQLIGGECHLGGVRFREGSCRARGGTFVVAARVCDDAQQAVYARVVREAVMDPPVIVRDRRNKYNEKRHPPNLEDEVYRLEKIALNGEYHKRLKDGDIYTVEHFLKALYEDEDNLAQILQIKTKKRKDWRKMVKHARECRLEGKPELKSYRCAEKNVVLFFNCVRRLVGAEFGCRYVASEAFEPTQQNLVATLKKDAYDRWDGLPEDHVMKDDIPVPICMDADTTGPGQSSCTLTSATLQIYNSDHHIAAHQVGGTPPAAQVPNPNAPTAELVANDNDAPGPSSSIPDDPYSARNYQAVQGLSHGLSESPCTVANYGPCPSLPLPHQPRTQNYQDEETRPAAQEQHLSAFHSDHYLDALVAQQAFSFGETDAIDMHLLVREVDASAFLQHQPDPNHYVEMESILWSGDETLEASASADINVASSHISMSMTLGEQQVTSIGAPGSAQGSVQGQTQAPPLDNGTSAGSGSSESAQQALLPQQWS